MRNREEKGGRVCEGEGRRRFVWPEDARSSDKGGGEREEERRRKWGGAAVGFLRKEGGRRD